MEIVPSRWPISSVQEARETPVEEIDVDLTSGAHVGLIHRAGFAVECELVDETRAATLEGLAAGRCRGGVTAGLAAGDADAVRGWLAGWVARRMIARVG